MSLSESGPSAVAFTSVERKESPSSLLPVNVEERKSWAVQMDGHEEERKIKTGTSLVFHT